MADNLEDSIVHTPRNIVDKKPPEIMFMNRSEIFKSPEENFKQQSEF